MSTQGDPSRSGQARSGDIPGGLLGKYGEMLSAQIWETDLRSLPLARRLLLRTARFLYVLVRDLLQGDLNLRAMSLVYSTLLSVVPLLAVSFSMLKGFGVHNQFEPYLYRFLEPLGPKGVEVGNSIIEFVENIRVGVLGAVGLGLLIYTVVSLLQKIVDRSHRFELTVVENGDPVTDILYIGEQVRRDNDGLAPTGKRQNQILDLSAADRIKP